MNPKDYITGLVEKLKTNATAYTIAYCLGAIDAVYHCKLITREEAKAFMKQVENIINNVMIG